MLSKGAFTALVDIRFHIFRIKDFVGGFTLETFEQDTKTLCATVRASLIWKTVDASLPPLLAIVEAELAAVDGNDGQG